MVVAVALIAILTASITSTFVEAAQRRHRAGAEAEERDSAAALHRQLDEVAGQAQRDRGGPHVEDREPPATPGPGGDR